MPKTNRPNILVIWGDDIGIANLSCYTHGLMGYRTPNIDRLAKEGMMFTDCYGEQSCTAGQNNYGTPPPSPSRRCASFTVCSGNGGRPEAESILDVNGWDRMKSSAAPKCLGSWRSTGRSGARRTMDPRNSNEGRRSYWRKRVA
jgi:Sulfatase